MDGDGVGDGWRGVSLRNAEAALVNRTRRASTAAGFTYLRFALSIVVGILLVPFVLDQVGIRLYGYWLASGELLAYAAMADFGVLAIVPWLVADADGRGDRQAIRRLLSTGLFAALVLSLIYLALVVLLWQIAPGVLRLSAEERAAIAGPLALLAGATAIVLPLRIASAALMGLQDVKVFGALTTSAWALDVALTVILLLQGYGLYALAIGAAIPSLVTGILAIVRLRSIAPDLATGWPWPFRADIARMFREGLGVWLANWGWRLTVATDGIVLATLGAPTLITSLAMTGKLPHLLTNMSWVPGDSSMVGLANLAGEDRPERVNDAVTAIFRVYLGLAGAGACAVLAANGAFVGAWVGADLFAGLQVTVILAALMIVATLVHGAAAIASVLGMRMRVGLATLVAGVLQVALAFVLARRLGLLGVPLAALCIQAAALLPFLVRTLARTGFGMRAMIGDLLWPWALRSVPLMVVCVTLGHLFRDVPFVVAVAIGGVAGLINLWLVRPLILGYPPVAALVRGALEKLKLDGLLLPTPP
jgi:Na+-driven multidrug efflux pump